MTCDKRECGAVKLTDTMHSFHKTNDHFLCTQHRRYFGELIDYTFGAHEL